MLDYRGLEALFTVIKTSSFQAAAEKICISQSAISQRIKGLESLYGQPLLVRTQPYVATTFAETLLAHYQRVKLLESELENELENDKLSLPKLSIALSRDSLETWFMTLLQDPSFLQGVNINIITDDQETTLSYLKKGLVLASITASEKSIPGCESIYVGDFEYVLACTPDFKAHHFKKNNAEQNLLSAPTLIFDHQDDLLQRYLKLYFDTDEKVVNFDTIPSVRGFKQFTLSGRGYSLIPKIDILNELKSGSLVQPYPSKVWRMPVYLHYWQIQTPTVKQFYNYIVKNVTELLNPI